MFISTGNCSDSYIQVCCCFFSFGEIYIEARISNEPRLHLPVVNLFSASMTTLQVVIGDLVRFSCSFNRINCAFTFNLCYHESHTTKTAPNMAFSILQLLMFVNAANKDVAVDRFRVPAASANATR